MNVKNVPKHRLPNNLSQILFKKPFLKKRIVSDVLKLVMHGKKNTKNHHLIQAVSKGCP